MIFGEHLIGKINEIHQYFLHFKLSLFLNYYSTKFYFFWGFIFLKFVIKYLNSLKRVYFILSSTIFQRLLKFLNILNDTNRNEPSCEYQNCELFVTVFIKFHHSSHLINVFPNQIKIFFYRNLKLWIIMAHLDQ